MAFTQSQIKITDEINAYGIDARISGAIAIAPDWWSPALYETVVKRVERDGWPMDRIDVKGPLYKLDYRGDKFHLKKPYAAMPMAEKLFNATSAKLQQISRTLEVFRQQVVAQFPTSGNVLSFVIITRNALLIKINRWLNKVWQALDALVAKGFARFPFTSIYVPCVGQSLLVYYDGEAINKELSISWIARNWYINPDQPNVLEQLGDVLTAQLQAAADLIRQVVVLMAPMMRKLCEVVRLPIVRAIFEGDLSLLTGDLINNLVSDPVIREVVKYGLFLIVQAGLNFVCPGSAVAVYAFFSQVCRVFGYVELAIAFHDIAMGCVPGQSCYQNHPSGPVDASKYEWAHIIFDCPPPPPGVSPPGSQSTPPGSQSTPVLDLSKLNEWRWNTKPINPNLYPTGSLARYNSTRRAWSIYAPVGALMPAAASAVTNPLPTNAPLAPKVAALVAAAGVPQPSPNIPGYDNRSASPPAPKSGLQTRSQAFSGLREASSTPLPTLQIKVIPPTPAGTVRVAEVPSQAGYPPPAGTTNSGKERDSAWYDNQLVWVAAAGAVVIGGMLIVRRSREV